jgi:hypothetical protein
VTSPPATNGRKSGKPEVAAFDLDAAVAASQGEATAAPFPFTWKGERYEMPPVGEWPVSALDLLTEGDLGGALAELLGADTYSRLKEAGLTLGALNRLFDQAATVSGFGGLPNSPRPTPRATTPT